MAKSKLPGSFNGSTMLPNYEVGRATKYAASALLGKLLFLTGKYTEAEQEFDFIINAAENEGRYALEEPIAAFNKLNIHDIPKETILEFNTGISTNSNQSQYMYYAMIISLNFRDAKGGGRGLGKTVKSSWNQYTMSYWALKTMGWMNDPQNGDYSLTGDAKSDLRMTQVYNYFLGYKEGITDKDPDYLIYESIPEHRAVTTPQVYVDKYFRGGSGAELSRYTKAPLVRLADIYISRAWLKWKKGDMNGAANDLNKVWNRANPDHLNRYAASNINHEAIFKEYLKEMSGEGWTLDFMMSTQMDVPVGDLTDASPIPAHYSSWHWAVPQQEVALNPNYK